MNRHSRRRAYVMARAEYKLRWERYYDWLNSRKQRHISPAFMQALVVCAWLAWITSVSTA